MKETPLYIDNTCERLFTNQNNRTIAILLCAWQCNNIAASLWEQTITPPKEESSAEPVSLLNLESRKRAGTVLALPDVEKKPRRTCKACGSLKHSLPATMPSRNLAIQAGQEVDGKGSQGLREQ